MVGIAAWMLVAGCWPVLVRGVRGFTRDGGAPSVATGEGAVQGAVQGAPEAAPRAAVGAS
jgi:hypothetical protein